jgi:hypothetical protein
MKTSWKWAITVILPALVVPLVLYGGPGKAVAATTVHKIVTTHSRAMNLATMTLRTTIPEPDLPPLLDKV